MARIIHFRSLTASVFFFVLFLYFAQSIITNPQISARSNALFLVVVTTLTIYITWYLGRRIIYTPVPLLIVIFTFGLLFFVSPPMEKLIFLMCSSSVFYITLLGIVRNRDNPLDATAKSFLSIGLVASLFLYFSVAYGIYINYDISLWLFILASFAVIFIATSSSLSLYSESPKKTVLYSLILSLAMAQLMWMANFWPFNYSTMAAVNLMFYYVLWDMIQSSFTGLLSKKHTFINLIFAVGLLLVVLLSTRWVLVS